MDYNEFCQRYNIKLTEQQAAAVQRVNGATLLLAVPGSGKTTVIVARTGYLLQVAGVNPRNILTITFTKAAAREMKERFIKKFGLGPNDSVPHFSTINSFCLSVLRICQREKGIRVPTLVPNNNSIIRDIAKKMMHDYPSDATVNALGQNIGKAKNELMDDEQLKAIDVKVLDFRDFFHAYQSHLKDNFLMDFDDQLLMANDMLDQFPDLLNRARRQYRYISLDEAQDTSLVQHLIVQKLAGKNGNIFMVGDEDQSIYGSRGAHPASLLSFEQDYENANVIYMDMNFRSDQCIVQATRRFITRNSQRRDKNMTAASRADGEINIIPLGDLKNQARLVLGEIKKALADPSRTLGVLYRNNYSAIPILNLLRKEGVSVRAREAANLYLTHYIVSDITALLRLAMNPRDIHSFRQVYYKLGLYMKATLVDATEEAMQANSTATVWTALDVPQKLRCKLHSIGHDLKKVLKMNPVDAIDQILYSVDYWDSWLQRKIDEGESELSILIKVAILKMVAMEYDTVQDFLTGLEAIGTYQGNTTSNVTLSTIHSSKGLEFDRVILIDVFNGILPSIRNDKELDDEEEEVRLFYVGATRAKHELNIVLAHQMFGYPLELSEFLEDFVPDKS